MEKRKLKVVPNLVIADNGTGYRRAGVLAVDIELTVKCPKCEEITTLKKDDDQYLDSQIVNSHCAQAEATFPDGLQVNTYGMLTFELIMFGHCEVCDNEIFAAIAPLEVTTYSDDDRKKYKFIMGPNPGAIEWDGNLDNQPEEISND